VSTPLFHKKFRGGRAFGGVIWIVVGLSFLSIRGRAEAAALQEYSVKAALLFNIAKYTDWPPDAFPGPGAPIVIGVLGDDPFGQVLDRIVNDRSIKGRSIVIRRATGIATLEDAHVVFVSASQPQAPQDCATLERSRILTVGDTEATAGYAAVNFAVRSDKVVFTVDLRRTLSTRAAISSQLLKFAQSVRRAEEMVVR
jgi:hypothetical protein